MTFLVVSSIIVHGSTVAVFTLGKHINTLTLTMSYTMGPDDGPSWMNRLPRISSQSRSQARTMSDTDMDELKLPDFPPGTLPPVGYPGQFLRRQKEEDNPSAQGSRASSLVGRRRRRKWDDGIGPGGPVTRSAVFPQRRSQSEQVSAALHGGPLDHTPPDRQDTSTSLPSPSPRRENGAEPRRENGAEPRRENGAEPRRENGAEPRRENGAGRPDGDETQPDGLASPTQSPRVEVFDEGDNIIIENERGDVLAIEPTPGVDDVQQQVAALKERLKSGPSSAGWTYESIKKRIGNWKTEEMQKRKEKQKEARRHEPARAYQFGNTVTFFPAALTTMAC